MVAITKSTLLAVSKGEWSTKEEAGKSIKNVLCALMSPLGLKQSRTAQACNLSHYRATFVWRH